MCTWRGHMSCICDACISSPCVCMSGLFIRWVLGICLCTCIGRCLEYAGVPGGHFGYLDKGMCLYLCAVPEK